MAGCDSPGSLSAPLRSPPAPPAQTGEQRSGPSPSHFYSVVIGDSFGRSGHYGLLRSRFELAISQSDRITLRVVRETARVDSIVDVSRHQAWRTVDTIEYSGQCSSGIYEDPTKHVPCKNAPSWNVRLSPDRPRSIMWLRCRQTKLDVRLSHTKLVGGDCERSTTSWQPANTTPATVIECESDDDQVHTVIGWWTPDTLAFSKVPASLYFRRGKGLEWVYATEDCPAAGILRLGE